MILNRTDRPSHSSAYAAWMDAASAAHRTGDAALKARAERLYIEYKFIERRSAKTRAAMNRN